VAPAAETDPLLAVAGPLMGLLEKMLNRPAAALPAAPQRNLVPGRTSAAAMSTPLQTPPAPLSTIAPPPADVEPFIRLARSFLPVMLKEAASGRDGYTWGLYTAQRVKEAFKPHLEMIAAAESAERMQLLTSLEPAFADHTAWVEDAADGILDALHPEDADEGTTDADPSSQPDGASLGPGGSNGHSSHDAAAHPPAGVNAAGEGTRSAT